eukprot:g28784.t1
MPLNGVEAADTAFILICAALVQLMTPGLAFFYGGLVKDTSVLTMMMQCFISMGVTSIFWFLFGFSLCFGESVGFFGNPWTYMALRGLSSIPGLLFMAYQGMFAVITPALMTGAFADRFRFKPYLFFIVLWLLFVYCPWCHWLWGGGFLYQWGCRDFAGGIVVHVTAGFGALASLFVVGKREIPEHEKDHHRKPHNVPFVALGTALLWFGWFGFNPGDLARSALACNGVAVAAAVNSEIAASVSTFLWLLIEWIRLGRPTLIGLCVGAIAGLATITPAAGFVEPSGAFVYGLVATFFCFASCELIKQMGLDDALDVWGVHGMGGWIGSILLGAFADSSECMGASPPSICLNPGVPPYRSWEQLGKQTVATLFCSVYSLAVSWVLLKAISMCMPLKPQSLHVDLHEHHEQEVADFPESGVLCVHAYGRLEEVHVQPLTLKKLRQAAKDAFDLPDTEILLKGPDGSCAESDEMLKNLASVYLELPDGGLHDLEQRIDQLQHLQVSHVCDRLATLADEQVSHQASIAGLTDALIEEQAFRQEFEEAVRAEIKHECDGVSLHLKKRMDQLEIKLREHSTDRLKDLEQRVICSSATAREASASITALRSSRLEVGSTVKECLEGQAKLSARIDDLCDGLVKEVQDRMSEARRLQSELSKRDERTESLRDFGQDGHQLPILRRVGFIEWLLKLKGVSFLQELHAAMTTLRSQPEAEGGVALRTCEKLQRLADESMQLERRFSDLSQQVEEGRDSQRKLQQGLEDESAARIAAEARLGEELSVQSQSLLALEHVLQDLAQQRRDTLDGLGRLQSSSHREDEQPESSKTLVMPSKG